MDLFSYHPTLKTFQGKSFINSNIIPANSTTIPNPSYGQNEIPVFDIEEKKWNVVKDFRGISVTNKITKEVSTYELLGDIDENFTIIPCPDKSLFSWKNEGWVQDEELIKAKDRKNRRIELNSYQWMFDRHASEKRLISSNVINKTSLTDEQIMELDVYFNNWRNFMGLGWYVGKEYPVKPSFLEVI